MGEAPRDAEAMTVNEAAVSLDISPDSVRKAIKRGTLDAKRRGRDWWITNGAVERYRRVHQAHCHICEGRCARPDMHWRSYDEEGNLL